MIITDIQEVNLCYKYESEFIEELKKNSQWEIIQEDSIGVIFKRSARRFIRPEDIDKELN